MYTTPMSSVSDLKFIAFSISLAIFIASFVLLFRSISHIGITRQLKLWRFFLQYIDNAISLFRQVPFDLFFCWLMRFRIHIPSSQMNMSYISFVTSLALTFATFPTFLKLNFFCTSGKVDSEWF